MGANCHTLQPRARLSARLKQVFRSGLSTRLEITAARAAECKTETNLTITSAAAHAKITAARAAECKTETSLLPDSQTAALTLQPRARLSARLKQRRMRHSPLSVSRITAARAAECKTETTSYTRFPVCKYPLQPRARLSARLKQGTCAAGVSPAAYYSRARG